MGWDYAIQWLTILPFEISAAVLTLEYWKASRNLDHAVWVTVFLVMLIIIQFFGIRGYGETEFVLSIIKIIACTGFIILGIIINVGGVPTDDRGYIGGRYWQAPHQPFKNGFLGFCGVFVTAAFAFGGTELTGLAAAEAANPIKSIPMATKQVLWRISFFYILCLLMVGLNVSSDDSELPCPTIIPESPLIVSQSVSSVPPTKTQSFLPSSWPSPTQTSHSCRESSTA